MPSAKRCAFKQGSRRCGLNGIGTPPLCDAHRVAVEAASRPRPPGEVLAGAFVDLLSGRPINRDQTLGAIQDIAQQWSGTVGGNYRPDVYPGESEGSIHRRAQPGSQAPWSGVWPGPRGRTAPPPPPQPNHDERRCMAARQVLGFKPQEPLTLEQIKARHRRLLRKHHPDHGGSTERMAVINDARDILIASL